MITLPTTTAAHQAASDIVSCANNCATAIGNLHKGGPALTTAQIEQELGPLATAQVKTLLAAVAQTSPAKHAAALAALQ